MQSGRVGVQWRVGAMRWAAILWLVLAAAAQAEVWEVRIGPVKAAELVLNGAEAAGRYQVSALLRTTGLVRLAARVSYRAEVRGRIALRRLLPSDYEERTNTGRRVGEARLAWQGGMPSALAYAEAGGAPAVRGPKGSIDPLTAIWIVARPVKATEACGQTLRLFDGRRESRLDLGRTEREAGGLACQGSFRRVAGYTTQDLDERTVFPLVLHYSVEDGIARLGSVELTTLYGIARIDRR